MTTGTPAAAKRRAMPSPMPPLPPMTITAPASKVSVAPAVGIVGMSCLSAGWLARFASGCLPLEVGLDQRLVLAAGEQNAIADPLDVAGLRPVEIGCQLDRQFGQPQQLVGPLGELEAER